MEETNAIIRVYLNTYRNYARNGAEGGEWLELPMENEELHEALERIASRLGETPETCEWMVNDYEWVWDSLGKIGESANIYGLNFLANRIADMECYEEEYRKLQAIIWAYDYSVADALLEMNNFTFYYEMSLREVAEELVEECYDLPEFALRYFDYDAFARDLELGDGYTETEWGVIVNN